MLISSSALSINDFCALLDGSCPSKNENVKVLYTSMPEGPANVPDIIAANPAMYIPNSIYFDFQHQFADKNSRLSNTMISEDEFAIQASAIGLTSADTLIIYDNFGNFCASRVWFMFKSMGHKKVYVLDGGLPEYIRSSLPTSNTLFKTGKAPLSQISKSTSYVTKLDPNFEFVDLNYVSKNLITQQAIVADARSYARYLGATPESKPGVRAGRIPHSVSMHYASLQDKAGRFLPLSTLRDIFAPFTDKPLIFSCGSGVTACILAQAATIAGIKNVKVYDGSWSQWGACETLPVETGTP